jgi:hypothetical protein
MELDVARLEALFHGGTAEHSSVPPRDTGRWAGGRRACRAVARYEERPHHARSGTRSAVARAHHAEIVKDRRGKAPAELMLGKVRTPRVDCDVSHTTYRRRSEDG